MKSDKVKVSYRDREAHIDISLGEIELQQPETVAEALELYGEEDFLDYAYKAYVIEEQRKHRDAHRPDKPKSVSNLAKFKQLSADKQEELLRQYGVL